MDSAEITIDSVPLERLTAQLDQAIERMAAVSTFGKVEQAGRIHDLVRRLLCREDGFAILYDRIQALEAAGIFTDSDWAYPEILQPSIAAQTLRGGSQASVILEGLNEIRMLAIANGDYYHTHISAEQALHFVTQVVALNLDTVFMPPSEADRVRLGGLRDGVTLLLNHLIQRIGYESILDRLIAEVWRILSQRPIVLDSVKAMITQIAICQEDPNVELGTAGRGAERLVSALFSPTNGSREDPGLDIYRERLEAMDLTSLQQEASGLARAMHDTGIVSAYHTVFLRFAIADHPDLVSDCLGLSDTGRDSLLCYRDLVHRLIEEAVFPETAQAAYGLALILERGIMHSTSVPPALWRQIHLKLNSETEATLAQIQGTAVPAKVHLLAGVLNVLGQPLGIAQGDNPTCQAARAMSIWSLSDPDYLLQLIVWAARDGDVVTQFENAPISSQALLGYYGNKLPRDVDPVSIVLVPHLDRIYMEMGRLCVGRGEDPHRWINPEFHGWRTGRGFGIAIDIHTGLLKEYEAFLRGFYATYHPYFNGGQPIIHVQPAGLAVTDSAARFVGWHAITILRVALDQDNVMRVYFYNPNADSGQDWGQDIIVSTEGHGERYGEASLPFAEFASRLYIYHFDPAEQGDPAEVDAAEVKKARKLGEKSWAAEKHVPESAF